MTSSFSADYVTARTRFRETAARGGWDLHAYAIDEQGPAGEDLTIDVAISGGAGGEGVLVLSSGLHGVEGLFGSAVQLEFLEEWTRRSETRPAIRPVLLHALNPYGFAWRRRWNEHNVDLNRNLLLEGQAFRGSPQRYRDLDRLLNPPRPPSRWEPTTLKCVLAIARYGMPALKEAVASGQHDFPRGLFYGGDRPSRTSEILAAHLDRWLGEGRCVVHLDFHTGLGAWATHKLLIDDWPSEASRQRLERRFGPDSFEVARSPGIAYAVRGGFGRWLVSRNRERDYLYACAEFGTYAPTRVVAGLRAENQAHHWGRPEDAATERAKQRLVELFCPQSEEWRTRVLEQSRRLITDAADALMSDEIRVRIDAAGEDW